jgi:hypothetical protein
MSQDQNEKTDLNGEGHCIKLSPFISFLSFFFLEPSGIENEKEEEHKEMEKHVSHN